MRQDATYRWYKSPNGPAHPIATAIAAIAIFCAVAGMSVLLGVYLIGGAFIALAFTTVVAFVKASPRISPRKHGVEVFPRPPLANSHYVFPPLAFLAAVLITVQPVFGQSMNDDVRFPVIVVAAWIAVVAGLSASVNQRGNLLIDSERIAIGRHPAVLLGDVQLNILQARKKAIPHIALVDTSGKTKKRLIFPQKYYGLDADSVYSTVRHLAETDAETRRSYSPELIREMLLFTPDREVPVGESIEVRIVARPTVRTP